MVSVSILIKLGSFLCFLVLDPWLLFRVQDDLDVRCK